MKPTLEEALFAEALERPAPERAAFLDGACRGDRALRQRLEALLAADREPDKLPPENAPAIKATVKLEPPPSEDETIGKKIGPYKLLQKIGECGCGAVYMAGQEQPVHRRVALKVIKLGMDTKAVIARFEAVRTAAPFLAAITIE